jgi:methyl-accepting chemotaxis protein
MSKLKNASVTTKILLFTISNIILIGIILISFSYFLQSQILLETLKDQTSETTHNWYKELSVADVINAKKEKGYNGIVQKKLTKHFDELSRYNPSVAQGYIFGTELQDGNKTSIINMPSHVIKAFKENGLNGGDMYEQPDTIAKGIKTMLKTEKTTFTKVYDDDYGTWITILYPLRDNSNNIFAYFGVDVDASMIPNGQRKLLVNSIRMLIIFLLIVILIQYFIIKKLLSPIKSLVQAIDKVSEGDLNIKLKTGNDELGIVNEKFNIMSSRVREMILKVKQTSDKIDEFSKEILVITEENNEQAGKITEEIEEMAGGIETQEHATIENANAMVEIASEVEVIANNATNVSYSATNMEKKSEKGNEAIGKVVDQMVFIADSVKETSSAIKSLDDRSKEIDGIMEIITDISDKTNLLALNAAIEAARAGEHGKGFAVVADEVRKLAEQSKNSADQIVELIKVIQSEITKAVESMNSGNKEVQVGRERAKETGDLFIEILKITRDVTLQIQEVSSSSQQISATTEEVTATATSLTEVAKQTSVTSYNIASNVKLQQDSLESITSKFKQLTTMSEDLQELISKFSI